MAKQITGDSQKRVTKSEEIRRVLRLKPNMKTKEVVSTLAEKGIEVTPDLVYFVKGQIKGRKKPKKHSRDGSAKAAKPAGTVSMSESIRNVLKANRGMKAKEVVATLARQGIEVKEGLVYLVKGQLKGRHHRNVKARKMAEQVAETTGTIVREDAVTLILKVKRLAAEVGGMAKLKALVEALSQ